MNFLPNSKLDISLLTQGFTEKTLLAKQVKVGGKESPRPLRDLLQRSTA